MPIQGCSSGWAVTAVVTTLLLLPARYYAPSYRAAPDGGAAVARPQLAAADDLTSALPLDLDIPGLDIYLTASFIVVAMVVYLCDWIQRKLMERRIIKLNQYLTERMEKLRVWDARQEKQESALRLVQNATSEYNILLYLLLRQHKLGPDWQDFDASPSDMPDFF